ncbi:MAG: phosphatidylglycerophosphatase A [Candidatus Omnitrophota bacterium]
MKKWPIKDKACLAIATLFGIGYVPLCPGTASCVVAVGVYLIVPNPFYFLIITLFSTLLAFLVSTPAEKIFGKKDCSFIVIDDFSGMLITLLFIPRDIRFIIPAFFLFRMLDMFKIPPADKVELYPGARGIVGDDVVAGVYANVILHIVRILIRF